MIVIEVSVAVVTVRVAELLVIDPEVAVIFVEPALTAVAKPLLLIVATEVLEEAQVTLEVRFCVDPLEKVPVAVNCCVALRARTVLAGVTAIETKVAAVTVKVAALLIMDPEVAVILTEPPLTPEASPLLLIVAIAVFDEPQVAVVVRF